MVSIVIPLYNREEIVKETLDSVLAQTYPNWECIVVDDVSTDNSMATAQEYALRDSRFKIFRRHREPKGAPTCRNIGLENAEGEYVIFLDSDDLLADFCIGSRVQHFLKVNRHLDFAVFQSNYIIEGHYLNEYPITKRSENYLVSFLSHDLPWCILSTLWHKEFLIRLNGFNEKYPRLQDPEIHTRALLINNVQFLVLPDLQPDSTYRISYKRPSMLPGLKGFYKYMSDIYSLACKSENCLVVRKSMKMHLKYAERFLVKNFERKHAANAYFLITKMMWKSFRYKIVSKTYLIKFFSMYLVFNVYSLWNLKKSQEKFFPKFERLN